jgi:hypothetical protein
VLGVVGSWFANQQEANRQHQAAMQIMLQREQSEIQAKSALFEKLLGQILGAEKPSDIESRVASLQVFMYNFHDIFNGRSFFHVIERDVEKLEQPRQGKIIKELRELAQGISNIQRAMIRTARFSDRHHEVDACVTYKGDRKPVQGGQIHNCDDEGNGGLLSLGLNEKGSAEISYTPAHGHIWSRPIADTHIVTVKVTEIRDTSALIEMNIIDDAKLGDRDAGIGDPEALAPFVLSYFGTPFTDNTLLPDGHRIALLLQEIDAKSSIAKIRILHFPDDYIPAGYRPTITVFRDLVLEH